MNKKVRTILVLAPLLAVLFLSLPNLIGISTSEDLDKCKSIAAMVKRVMTEELNGVEKVVYCTPGVDGILFDTLPVLSIYGLVDENDHKIILTRLKDSNDRPFNVVFYDKEDFILSKDEDGKIVGKKRGYEKEIANYKIK